MNEETLFTIKKDNLETGLRGMPVGYCTTSEVRPQEGLFYKGYPVKDLAYKNVEEVIYLLFYGNLPEKSKLESFKDQLKARRKKLDLTKLLEHLKSLPLTGHPFKWFLSAINYLGLFSTSDDVEEDGYNLIAALPTIVAAIFRIREGWGDLIPSDPNLDYMEDFVQMLNPPQASEHLLDFLKVFEILHFDHGGGNLSTFVGKVIASGHADVYESILGAMAGLAGPLHGKANQECLKFIKRVHSSINNVEDEKEVENYLTKLFQEGGKIYGFGHAVLRVEDPRATIQYEIGEKIAPNDDYFKLALTLRKVGSEFLSKIEKISNPYPNVDAVSGSLLNACGLTNENYYTILFGMSRAVGITAQIFYERLEARGGKGTPIVRPKYIYSGPTPK